MMKKVLIVDTTYPINSRTERFRKSLQKVYDVHVCSWSRSEQEFREDEKSYVYKTNVGYGNKIRKLIKLPIFMLFVSSIAKKIKPDLIFASHWDSLCCAVFYKIFFSWKVKIVYDCLDLPTSSNKLICLLLKYLEKFNLIFVDKVVLASRYFSRFYDPKEIFIFENYPSSEIFFRKIFKPNWFNGYDEYEIKQKKNLAWIGVVRYSEIIENILISISQIDVNFYIFGDGPELKKVREMVDSFNLNDRVIFFGRYDTEDLKFIYELVDLVWAAYPTKDFNAVYAISNKYFECSYFNKTPVFSKKTKMAESLSFSKSVVLVDEYSVKDIKSKIIGYFESERKKFVKYEKDTLWEKKEVEFLSFIKDQL